MSTDPLLLTVDFTRSVGHRQNSNDGHFDDIVLYGGFPFEQKITAIREIEVFADMKTEDDAVIVGMKVTYDMGGTNQVVDHGLVNETSVGKVTIAADEYLVGAFGRHKKVDVATKNGRLGTIGFVVFHKVTGQVTTEGPFPNKAHSLGAAWATLGPIIAFQGTKTDPLGITTLGFVKPIQGVPGHGVF